MNPFDSAIVHFLNGYAHRSALFDSLLYLVTDSNFLKGGVVMGFLWWLWFGTSDEDSSGRTREILIASIMAAMISVLVGMMLQAVLPFRLRPMNEPGVHFTMPFGVPDQEVTGWRDHHSFPSDHAELFFGLTAGIFLVSRKAGIFLFIYLFMVIAFGRVYSGLHYPTDVLAGAAIGIVCSLFMNRARLRERVSKPVLHWLSANRAAFYAIFFLLSYELVSLFNDVRSFGGFILRVWEGKI